jgi:hypothetical protein
VKATLDKLGVAVNWEKSKEGWQPRQQAHWIGIDIDTQRGLYTIPPRQMEKLKGELDSFLAFALKGQPVWGRAAAKMAGRIICWHQALGPAMLLTRELYTSMATLHGDYNGRFTLSQQALADLRWLRDSIEGWNGRSIWRISRLLPVKISTDASGHTWFAVLSPGTPEQLDFRGSIPEEDRRRSSAYRETLAIERFIHLRGPERLRGCNLQIRLDALTVAGALTRGSTSARELWPLLSRVLRLALRHGFEISTTWIPRELNRLADAGTRHEADPGDWRASAEVLRQARTLWPELLEAASAVDRFAGVEGAHALPRYNTRFYDQGAEAYDCYTQDWSGAANWLVPPFSQVGRALQHLAETGGEAVLVYPEWPSQPWWPMLRPLVLGQPQRLPASFFSAGPSGVLEPSGHVMLMARLHAARPRPAVAG